MYFPEIEILKKKSYRRERIWKWYADMLRKNHWLPFGENLTKETGGLSSSIKVFRHWPGETFYDSGNYFQFLKINFTWGCVPNPAESIVATADNQTPVPSEIWYRPSTKAIFDMSIVKQSPTCWSGQQTQDLNVPAMFSGISPFSRPRSAQTRQKNLENGIYWALHNRYLNKQCFRFLPDTTRLDWGLKLQQKA